MEQVNELEIAYWLTNQNYQTDSDATGEYRLYYAIDMPAILNDFLQWRNEVENPPHQPKLTWQAKAKNSDEWLDISDEEYENTMHLSRFEFRRIEK